MRSRVFPLLLVLACVACGKRRVGTSRSVENGAPETTSTTASGDASVEPSPVASADPRAGDYASSDGRYRLRADASWRPHKAKDARCVLSLASERAFAYLYVEKKIDLVAANLDAYVDSSLEHKRAFKNVATKNPVLRATVGGRPARETELDFEEDGYRWRELYTVVEFEDEYVEISIVAKPSKYAKSVFQHLVQGLSATPR